MKRSLLFSSLLLCVNGALNADSCCPEVTCCPQWGLVPCERFYIAGSYLLSWFKPGPVDQPLITTGSATDAHPGAIGQPGTRVLFGNDHLHFKTLQGVRVDMGVFIDPDDHYSLDASGFAIFPNHRRFSFSSDAGGNPVIMHPIVNVLQGIERVFAVSFPGVISGNVQVNAKAELFGAELDATYHLYPRREISGDFFVGFRYANLQEELEYHDHTIPLLPGALSFFTLPLDPPDSQDVIDKFKTRNQFYGLQLGGKLRFEKEWFYLHAYGELGIGATRQTMKISGTTSFNTPTGTFVALGGDLTAPNTNIGNHHRTLFGLLPEVGVKLGYTPFSWLEFFAGYSFLYWNKVVRPGGKINRAVNPNLSPANTSVTIPAGPADPTFSFHSNSFWAQFFQIGLGFCY